MTTPMDANLILAYKVESFYSQNAVIVLRLIIQNEVAIAVQRIADDAPKLHTMHLFRNISRSS